MADAISYTAATGKRPIFDKRVGKFTWFNRGYLSIGADGKDELEGDVSEDLPLAIFARLRGGRLDSAGWRDYDTESAALKAADEAYLKAVADGAVGPIGEGVA